MNQGVEKQDYICSCSSNTTGQPQCNISGAPRRSKSCDARALKERAETRWDRVMAKPIAFTTKPFKELRFFDHHTWFDKKTCMSPHHSSCNMHNETKPFCMLSDAFSILFSIPSGVCVCVCPGQGRFTTAKRSKAIASWGMSTIAPQKLNTRCSIIWSCNQCNKHTKTATAMAQSLYASESLLRLIG